MSLRSGDRARAHKVTRKRRLRRSQLRILHKLAIPSKHTADENDAPAITPEKS